MTEHIIIATSPPDPVLIVQVARRFEALYGDHGPHVLRLVNDMADLIEGKTIQSDSQCQDVTQSPRGEIRCILPAGHDEDPLSLHTIDFESNN